MSDSPVIKSMRIVPVAGYDSMLLNIGGAHNCFFTRIIVILTDSAGKTGVGETPCHASTLQLLGRTQANGKVMLTALSADHKHLYAAIRSKPPQLMSWSIDSKTGDLRQANAVAASASYPYISTDKQGRFLLGASYDGDVVPAGRDANWVTVVTY